MNERASKQLGKVTGIAALVGVVGIALCAVGAWQAPLRFYEAYLFAFLVVSGIGLGSLAVAMIYQLVGGRWGDATHAILEAAAWPLLLAPVLAVPLLLSVDHLYPWTDAAAVADDEVLAKKALYLNVDFFRWRAVAYLVIWALLTILIGWWSRSAERKPETAAVNRARLRALSGPGLVLYGLTVTFAAIDWMMSLEPHWFSSIYGVIVLAGQGAAGFAVATVTLIWLRSDERLGDLANRDCLQDLGNLLLASVTFWIYVTFSQFLIIWSGNLTEEVPWYLARSRGGWQWLALVLVLLHFVVPFALLLSRTMKRDPRSLAGVAILVLIMHVVDIYWQVMPALRESLTVHWLDIAALVTLCAIWKAVSAWRLSGAAWRPGTDDGGGMQHENAHAIEQPA